MSDYTESTIDPLELLPDFPAIGETFKTLWHFSQHIRLASAKHGCELIVARATKTEKRFQCHEKGCAFRVNAQDGTGPDAHVTKSKLGHTCEGKKKESHTTSSRIEVLRVLVPRHLEVTSKTTNKEVIEVIAEHYGGRIDVHAAGKVRNQLLDEQNQEYVEKGENLVMPIPKPKLKRKRGRPRKERDGDEEEEEGRATNRVRNDEAGDKEEEVDRVTCIACGGKGHNKRT